MDSNPAGLNISIGGILFIILAGAETACCKAITQGATMSAIVEQALIEKLQQLPPLSDGEIEAEIQAARQDRAKINSSLNH